MPQEKSQTMLESLYEYSQLCCIVETVVFGITLMFIGNDRVKNSSWLKRAKWAIALVLLLVGGFTMLQYSINMKVLYPEYNTALNISMLYCVTFLLAIAFLPVANKARTNHSKIYATLVVFALCGAIVWISTLVESSIATILRVCSLALYLFELVRITISFVLSFKMYDRHKTTQRSENEARISYLTLLAQCVIALSIYALLYVLLILWSEKTLAFFNFATLPMWVYVFVTFVNIIINYLPNDNERHSQISDIEQNKLSTSQQDNLKAKLGRWISTRDYCKRGITLIQVAEQLGTNRTYLSRYINDTTGDNFNTWLTRLRIEEAKRLLISSPALSIDKVAWKVGFASKSHFMSSFKSLVGTTPGQWREQNWETPTPPSITQ